MKDWLDFRDREKDEQGIIKLSDEEILDIPLLVLRCWKFNKFGSDYLSNGESEYSCPNCPCAELCHKQEITPLERRYNKLKEIKIIKQATL
jgi:hypothetical protein